MFGYKVENYGGSSFNKGVRYGVGLKLGGSVDYYFYRSVGGGVDRYFGVEVWSGIGRVGWDVFRVIGYDVGRGVGGGVRSGYRIDRDVGDRFISGNGEVFWLDVVYEVYLI